MSPWRFLLGVILCALCSAPSLAEARTPREIFEEGLPGVEQRHPGLVTLERLSDGVALTGLDDAKRNALYDRVGAGEWSEEFAEVFRVVFAGMSLQAGTVAVEGRGILQVVSGLAAESGNLETIIGVTELLTEMMEDAAHSYSLLAQDLLSEKMRCGAASLGEDALVDSIAASVDPDRAYDFAGTDGTIGDRYGLHAASDLFSIAARGDVVVAVGYFGTVLVSDDSGEHFTAPSTSTDEPLFAVSVGAEKEWWAVGRGGAVLYSGDDGDSWQRRETPFQRHYFGVLGAGLGEALVVGDFGLQLITVDAGASWLCLPREEDVILGRVVPAGSDALVVGEFGTLERFSDNRPPGEQGKALGVPDDFYIFDAWFGPSGEIGIATGLGGAILRTVDGGEIWTRVATDFDADLYGVAGFDNRVFVVGEGGFIAVSEDAGQTFRQAKGDPPPVPLNDVTFDEAGRAYLVGLRGTIFRIEAGSEEAVRLHPKQGT